MSIDDPTGQLMRWRLRLSLFDFSIIYRPGRKHQVPDDISRLRRDHEPAYPSENDEIPTLKMPLS